MSALTEQAEVTNELPVDDDVQDLSFISKPMGSLFNVLSLGPDNYARYRLSKEQTEFYKANGYLSQVRVLTEEQCDRLSTGCSQYHTVGLCGRKHGFQGCMPSCASRGNGLLESPRVDVAHIGQFAPIGVLLDGLEMIRRDAAAPRQSETHLTITHWPTYKHKNPQSLDLI